MKLSQLLAPTLREAPADAEVPSHTLMLRAGLIRKLAAGIYEWLPLGVRVLRKVEQIIREEMNRIGGQEVWLPAMQPRELWEESGRWGLYGKELMRLKDRHDREFCLGPTHEEVITDLVRREVRSYRQIPLLLYQFQTKFRDEIRPRFGVMRARDLDDALALQNAPEFGLTGGLHSLDPDEIDHWTERVEVGNVYVNRHTTGAIVRRQPFGGWKHSAVGPGAKTGGPDDILRFVRYSGRAGGDSRASYDQWWRAHFRDPRDESGLHAERNELRYRPLHKVIVRAATSDVDELARAAAVTGTTVEIAPERETDDQLAARLAGSGAVRLRTRNPISDTLALACHDANVVVDHTPVTGHGRIELAHWVREQAISLTRHRHGRVPGS